MAALVEEVRQRQRTSMLRTSTATRAAVLFIVACGVALVPRQLFFVVHSQRSSADVRQEAGLRPSLRGHRWGSNHLRSSVSTRGAMNAVIEDGRSQTKTHVPLVATLVAPAALLAYSALQQRTSRRGDYIRLSEAHQDFPITWTPPANYADWLREQAAAAAAPAPTAPAPAVSTAQQQQSGAQSLALGFFLWYAANVSFNIVNKQALGLFPHAWTVSVVQLATVVLCSAIGWMTGLVTSPFQTMGPGFLRRLAPAAFCHALGNGLTSLAFSYGSVSFTHVVKTSEPIWMALGSFMMTGAVLPRTQMMALVPVMLGVALASAGELSFTWVGFLAALGSTIAFAGRGLLSKQLMGGSKGSKKMSPLNVYALDSLLALVFTLPMAALLDGSAMVSTCANLAAGPHQLLALGLLASTGLSYWAYNAIAFQLLGKLDVVSHAVGNLGKRIFVIGFSAVAFQTPLTLRAIAGSMMAIAGSGLYSWVKAASPTASSKSSLQESLTVRDNQEGSRVKVMQTKPLRVVQISR